MTTKPITKENIRTSWESMTFRAPTGELLKLVCRPGDDDIDKDAIVWFFRADNSDISAFMPLSSVERVA